MRFVIILLFMNGLMWAQPSTYVENIMATYPSDFKKIDVLAKRLQYDFKTDQQRVEAAYLWIANNIRYDHKKLYETTPKKVWIRYRTEKEKQKNTRIAIDHRLNRILKNRHTLCYGYSNMFQRLCELMGIKAVNINGYAKRSTGVIGDTEPFKNHSWNAVFLNDSWQLFDLTWAAGFTDHATDKWITERNDHYFNTDPQALISTHLPADPKWQLLQNPLSNSTFFKNPIYYPSYYVDQLLLDQKEDGILELDGRMVAISFASLPDEKPLYYSLNGSNKVLAIENIKQTEAGKYLVSIYGVNRKSERLTIYSDLRPAMDFKLQ